MAKGALPGISDIVRPITDGLVKEMDELRDRPEQIQVELRQNGDAIAVWFRTPMLSERDIGHLLSLRADGVPPFNLFVVHDPVGVRVELLVSLR